MSDRGHDLLRAIRDRPEDDDARLVYADWLIERGDPRGELIALQCAAVHRDLSVDERRRERQLLRKHQAEWLGELAPSLGKAVFERGFLASCTYRTKGPALAAKLVGRPMWATVTALTCIGMAGGARARADLLVTDPVMRALRELRGIDHEVMRALARRTPPLALETVSYGVWRAPDPALGPDLAGASGLPKLRRLAVMGYDPALLQLGWLPGSPLWRRLAHLSVATHEPSLGHWLDMLAAHPASLLSLTITPGASEGANDTGWTLRLTPDATGRFTVLAASFEQRSFRPGGRQQAYERLPAALRRVPADALTRITIDTGDFTPEYERTYALNAELRRFQSPP